MTGKPSNREVAGWAAPEEHTLPDDDAWAEVKVLLHDLQ